MVTEIKNATQKELKNELAKKARELYELANRMNKESGNFETTLLLNYTVISKVKGNADVIGGKVLIGDLIDIVISLQEDEDIEKIIKAYELVRKVKDEAEDDSNE